MLYLITGWIARYLIKQNHISHKKIFYVTNYYCSFWSMYIWNNSLCFLKVSCMPHISLFVSKSRKFPKLLLVWMKSHKLDICNNHKSWVVVMLFSLSREISDVKIHVTFWIKSIHLNLLMFESVTFKLVNLESNTLFSFKGLKFKISQFLSPWIIYYNNYFNCEDLNLKNSNF